MVNKVIQPGLFALCQQ